MGGRAAVAVCCALFGASLVGSPAQAAFPGQNGKIVFHSNKDGDYDVYSVNPDGSGEVNLTNTPWDEVGPTWSPDGTKIAFSTEQHYAPGCIDDDPEGNATPCNVELAIMNPDGSGVTRVTNSDPHFDEYDAEWYPNGTNITYEVTSFCGAFGCSSFLGTVSLDGSTVPHRNPGADPNDPAWSPDGQELAYISIDWPNGGVYYDLWKVRADNTLQRLCCSPRGIAGQPDWSPDGLTILLSYQGHVVKMNRDGSGFGIVKNQGFSPSYSPDGTKIAFAESGGISMMDADGTDVTPVVTNGSLPDWQPIPVNSYPRPRGATPIQVSMVPAYTQCTAPNRTHGPPLAFPSCASPTQSSDELTVGTPDANAKPAKSRGTVRYDAIAGVPATPTDEADVQVAVELFDIYEQGALTDYTAELRAHVTLRITDKLNTPHPGGPGAATVTDASLGAAVPCAATADTTEGATCNLVTTFDAIVPGTVTETKRSIWALGPAQLQDGGADNDADTTGDNTLFMTQGLFVP